MTEPASHSISVTVRGLRKSYNEQPVIKGVDLSVERGEIFVIMGPSGSGKSVLLKHIIGLEKPDAGDIYGQQSVSILPDDNALDVFEKVTAAAPEHRSQRRRRRNGRAIRDL